MHLALFDEEIDLLFDPAQEKFSVGQILLGYAFESAIGEGLKTFDMLKGDHAYKRSWSNDTRRTYEITAWRSTAAGLLSLGRYRLAKMRRRPRNARWMRSADHKIDCVRR